MSEETETVTVTKTVKRFLEVSIDGLSGVQKWGPFEKDEIASIAVALAGRDNVQKIAPIKEYEEIV